MHPSTAAAPYCEDSEEEKNDEVLIFNKNKKSKNNSFHSPHHPRSEQLHSKQHSHHNEPKTLFPEYHAEQLTEVQRQIKENEEKLISLNRPEDDDIFTKELKTVLFPNKNEGKVLNKFCFLSITSLRRPPFGTAAPTGFS